MSDPFPVPSPSCAAEAMAMAEAAFDFLNAEDVPSLPVTTLAELLKHWSRLTAKGSAAHAGLVGAFHTGCGPQADGQRSVGAWLTWFTRCTPAAGRGQVAAAFKIRRHPHVRQALAGGSLTESYGRWIAEAVERFPAEDREAVEAILVEAAVSGATLDDLVTIATAALRRLRPSGLEDEAAQRHDERNLTVSKTLGGAGRINGDLTAEATALTETVIEALAVKAGPEDTRTKAQRRHDALVEAFRRLTHSGLLPERGGSKPQVKVDMDLATLLNLPGSAQAEEEWIEHATARLTRDRLRRNGTGTLGNPDADVETIRALLLDQPPGDHRIEDALVDGPPSDQTNPLGKVNPPEPHPANGSRLSGPASGTHGATQPPLPGLGSGARLHAVGPIGNGLAGALACDSVITPLVTAAIDLDALAEMTEQWLAHHLPRHRPGPASEAPREVRDDGDHRSEHPPDDLRHTKAAHRSAGGSGGSPDRSAGAASDVPGSVPGSVLSNVLSNVLSEENLARFHRAMLRWAVQVLSGPGGLASYVRTRRLTGPLATPSIVLDAGTGDRSVPAALERLVRRRDRQCRFPGCDQPAALSQVHHLTPRSRNGPTALWNLLTLCSFHHLIAVHTWGWNIRLNADGTTTATAPDGRTLHEHDPPCRAA